MSPEATRVRRLLLGVSILILVLSLTGSSLDRISIFDVQIDLPEAFQKLVLSGMLVWLALRFWFLSRLERWFEIRLLPAEGQSDAKRNAIYDRVVELVDGFRGRVHHNNRGRDVAGDPGLLQAIDVFEDHLKHLVRNPFAKSGNIRNILIAREGDPQVVPIPYEHVPISSPRIQTAIEGPISFWESEEETFRKFARAQFIQKFLIANIFDHCLPLAAAAAAAAVLLGVDLSCFMPEQPK